jgi:hypothetical protein
MKMPAFSVAPNLPNRSKRRRSYLSQRSMQPSNISATTQKRYPKEVDYSLVCSTNEGIKFFQMGRMPLLPFCNVPRGLNPITGIANREANRLGGQSQSQIVKSGKRRDQKLGNQPITVRSRLLGINCNRTAKVKESWNRRMNVPIARIQERLGRKRHCLNLSKL